MNLKKLWNPVAFFISLFMSSLMPFIFAVLTGYMDLYTFVIQEFVRWPVAYITVNILVIPTSLKLSHRFFKSPYINKYFSPMAMFNALFMSFLVPLIVAVPLCGMPISELFLIWPIRWFVAYMLVNFFIRPLAIKCAVKVFNFKPEF